MASVDRLPVRAGRHLGLVERARGLGTAGRVRHPLARHPAGGRDLAGAARRGEVASPRVADTTPHGGTAGHGTATLRACTCGWLPSVTAPRSASATRSPAGGGAGRGCWPTPWGRRTTCRSATWPCPVRRRATVPDNWPTPSRTGRTSPRSIVGVNDTHAVGLGPGPDPRRPDDQRGGTARIGCLLLTVRFHDHGAVFGLPGLLRRPLAARIRRSTRSTTGRTRRTAGSGWTSRATRGQRHGGSGRWTGCTPPRAVIGPSPGPSPTCSPARADLRAAGLEPEGGDPPLAARPRLDVRRGCSVDRSSGP